MAGYSGTPLPKKLGIREGHRLALIDAPRGFKTVLGELPGKVVMVRAKDDVSPFDVCVVFCSGRAELAAQFAVLASRLAPHGGLWVAWPKKSSGVKTDLTEDIIREICLPSGLVDNKVCAIDETWSGLRFVRRVKDR